MATITFTLSTADATRVVNALGSNHETQVPDENGDLVNNPQSKAQFARLQLAQILKRKVVQHEKNVARAALSAPADLDVTVS